MIDLIQEKLRSYGAKNRLEEENATKEIMQEIALYALWKADFFDCASSMACPGFRRIFTSCSWHRTGHSTGPLIWAP